MTTSPTIFAAGDLVIYPTHGIGQIYAVEEQEISGYKLSVYVIVFQKDKMTLRLPVTKAHASGLRHICSPEQMVGALTKLQAPSRIRKAMWSRRAQEYEAKINSGDPISIAEVLRDLKPRSDGSEQSYSERQIYQIALERLAQELAAIEEIDTETAVIKLEEMMFAA